MALSISPGRRSAGSWSLNNGPFTIIDNDSSLDAVSGNFAVNNTLLFLTPDISIFGGDGNDVTLTLTRNTTDFASVANTGNQQAVGQAVDSGQRQRGV